MTSLRERVNSHIPILLKFLNTISLIAIAMSVFCASQSLKELTGSNQIELIPFNQD